MLSLPPKAQAKIARALDVLEEYGPAIGEPYIKSLAGHTGLSEVRVGLGLDAFRLFFFAAAEKHLVIVHGIRKKTQRTPIRDIETAEQRRAAYVRRR